MFSRLLIGAVAAAVGPAMLAAGPSLSVRAQAALTPQELRLPPSGGEQRVTLWVADGFVVDVFASRLRAARMLAQSPSGELVLSQHWEGRVVKLADRDGDGAADEVVTILGDFNIPHGLAFDGDALLIAESDKVIRLDPWWDGDSARELLRLPGHGHHETRSLLIGGDRKLYVSIGSSCDACVEQDPMRAAVWRFNLDGSGGEPYAIGLRNAVGLAWDARSGRAWVTENERNELGEDLPPDEVNALESGADFGWPYCFGMGIVAEPFDDAARCAQTRPPTVELPAHSAPLGLAFYDATRFPSEYRGDLFVALHGSALRKSPVGYSVVRVPIRDGQPQQAVDFIRGWLVGDNSWGVRSRHWSPETALCSLATTRPERSIVSDLAKVHTVPSRRAIDPKRDGTRKLGRENRNLSSVLRVNPGNQALAGVIGDAIGGTCRGTVIPDSQYPALAPSGAEGATSP